jgi:2-polyprenyl-3-methyl-5-hydroxy-6-metoxy-1,4-benzoquinol methylase
MASRIPPWALPPLSGETPAQTQARRDDAYFAEQQEQNHEWRARMGRPLDVEGKRVLDLGCGHGALSLLMAQDGASEVLGIDLDDDRIDYANRNVAARYPQYAHNLRFEAIDIAKLEGQYDVIISKDSFEHIDDLENVLGHIYRLLAPGGVLAAGFSPLYYSPFGDHGRYQLGGAPWLHAVIPEKILFPIASRRTGKVIRSATDVGLNKLTRPQLEQFLGRQPWKNIDIGLNRGSKPMFKLFSYLRKIPFLEKYLTINVYMFAIK